MVADRRRDPIPSSPARCQTSLTRRETRRNLPTGQQARGQPRRGEFSLSPRTGTFSGDGRRLAITDGTGSVFVWAASP